MKNNRNKNVIFAIFCLLISSCVDTTNHGVNEKSTLGFPIHKHTEQIVVSSHFEKSDSASFPIDRSESQVMYDLGYDQGFDDAGSLSYNDEPPSDVDSILAKYYRDGYEDGWIEWKNLNGDYDY